MKTGEKKALLLHTKVMKVISFNAVWKLLYHARVGFGLVFFLLSREKSDASLES